MWTWLLRTSTEPLGDALAVTEVSVLSKKLSPTHIYRCHLAPHRCGAQGQGQVIGQAYAGFSSLRTLLKDGKYVSKVHSPFPTIPWASVQRVNAAIMKCGCTSLSLITLATTNREKGMTNGFSSRKDQLHSNPARNEANQVRTIATLRFRHNHPCVQHGSHEHNWKGAHDRGTPSPSFNDLMRPRHLGVRLSPFSERVSITLHHVSCISHNTLGSWLMSPKKKQPKVIYTDNSLEFEKTCEDLAWNHRTSTPHRSETNGIAERAVRRVKEGASIVLLQSGLDKRWWSDYVECYCYLRNVQDLLADGKTPYERRFGEPVKWPIIPSGAMVEYHPFSPKDQTRIHQFGKKILPGIFLGYELIAG